MLARTTGQDYTISNFPSPLGILGLRLQKRYLQLDHYLLQKYLRKFHSRTQFLQLPFQEISGSPSTAGVGIVTSLRVTEARLSLAEAAHQAPVIHDENSVSHSGARLWPPRAGPPVAAPRI